MKRLYNVGTIGNTKTKHNGKHTKQYHMWSNMLTRCYNEKYQNLKETYKNCKVCEEWLCFENFEKWYFENYYDFNGLLALDKDILIKNNKIYSPNTCLLVPYEINSIFTKCDKARNNLYIGVTKKGNLYVGRVSEYLTTGERIYKSFRNPLDAFYWYKDKKEKYIKEIADKYKETIPTKVYNALYDYKVDIND